MPKFKLAHIKEQGQNMLLFPLDASFSNNTPAQREALLQELEDRAHAAGLAGRAAVFWNTGNRTFWLGPPPWRNFLNSINMHTVLASINKSISW
ncbi:hypothetical protein [Sphingomonas sp. LH128]|uniref:hypothetical protein n=1 Tax=Sphingomonas sp. LH128 TaxID=473781 RepID=UPI00155EFD9A|nr:hypothetical protein [Sphingomonas sp. LH128]